MSPQKRGAGPAGPWSLEADEHGETRRGWRLSEPAGRSLWLPRDEFMELEAWAVLVALNESAVILERAHREALRRPDS